MEQSENDTVNQQERLSSLYWLAGFLEGEGWITFAIQNQRKTRRGKTRIIPRIGVLNTEYVFIERAKTILTSLGIGCYIHERENGCERNPIHRSVKSLEINGVKRVSKLLIQILPFMTEGARKKEVGKLVLEYCQRRLLLDKNYSADVQEFSYVERVRDLNRKGKQVSSETIR